MRAPNKIPVLVAVGDFASGVTSWAFRLRDAFADHPRYTVLLLNSTATGNRLGVYDLHATTRARAVDVLGAFPEAIVIPNFVWELFPICADLNAAGHRLHCIGFCRADSEAEYYAPLRWYAPLAGQFAAVSPACGETLAAHVGVPAESIHVLPTGVRVPESLDRTYQTEPVRLAYGGRVVQEQKRVMDFVALVDGLYARGVDFKFSIAGTGRQLDELKCAMAEVDPQGRVHFVGRKKPDAMPAFWLEQDIFVQASAFEGTSNSMLESMAQGAVPVLTRTASGVAGIVNDGENGFLVPVGDMASMADAVARLAAGNGTLSRMGAAVHAQTRAYSMERYAAKFERLLDDALASPPAAWPGDRPIAPPKPFIGIRLGPDETTRTSRGRIAILFPSPLRGGAEDYTLAIARGAVAAGYDVQAGFPGHRALSGLAQEYFRAGAFHHTLDICDVGPKAGQASVYKRFTRTVRLLRRLRPKAVLFQLCGMQYGFMSLLGCAALRMPTLVVFQLVREDISFSAVRRCVYRRMRARGQRYVAVSSANRTLLARAFRMKEREILLIPNGVPIARFAADPIERQVCRAHLRQELGLPTDARLCLTVGRLSHQKGHDVLIPAIPHLVARFPDTYFLWAGEGPLEKQLRAQLATYGVGDRVVFLGRREDIPALLHACDLFIHPARFEGQPFSLLEAMAARLPIVSTTASGIAEAITDGEHGLLCRPDDIAALRDTVMDALADSEARERRADAARARVEAYSESAMIAQTLAALDGLAEGR